MKIVVTGSTGYIGKSLVASAIISGYDLVHLSRNCQRDILGEWLHFDISLMAVPLLPYNTKIVIHLAILKDDDGSDFDNKEILVTRSLLNESKRVGAKFIYISSQTARINAPTAYGRRKWIIEQDVISGGGIVIRSGLVYGGEGNGLFGELCKLVRKLYLLPSFYPSPMIQPIHIEDLVFAILKITTLEISPGRIFHLGSVVPISFTFFLKILAKELKVRRVFIPFPSLIIICCKSLFNRFTSLTPLNSLFDLPFMKTDNDLADLNIVLREIDSGIQPPIPSNERFLIQEAIAFYSYVMKATPSTDEISRYLLAIRLLRGGLPLQLPKIFIRFPIILSLVETHIKTLPNSKFANEFLWRLNATTRMAEATIPGAFHFLGFSVVRSIPLVILGICLSIIKSIIIIILATILRPLFWFLLREHK